MLPIFAEADGTVKKAATISLGSICLGAEVPISMDEPAVFMELDSGNKRFISNQVGKTLFSDIDRSTSHSIKVYEDGRKPVEVPLDFQKLKTNRAIIWKVDRVWKIKPADQRCENIH